MFVFLVSLFCFCSEAVVGGFVGPSEPYGSVGGMHLGSADIYNIKCSNLASVSSLALAIPTRLSRCRLGLSVFNDFVNKSTYSCSPAKPPSR